MPDQPPLHRVSVDPFPTYHVASRVVRYTCLWGWDAYRQRSFDHRRDWIEELIHYQAGVFAIDVGSSLILTTQLHLILRARPDRVARWCDEEVALRWKLSKPKWDGNRWYREPSSDQVEELLADPVKLARARDGLSTLSHFLSRSKEPISRMANQEAGACGHFWEQRFGRRKIEDQRAVLDCFSDIDELPVRSERAPLGGRFLNRGTGADRELERRVLERDAMEAREAALQREAQASAKAFGPRPSERSDNPFTERDALALFSKCALAPIRSPAL